MNLGDINRFFKVEMKENGPLLLSIAAGVGTLATVYLAARAGFKSAKVLDEYEENEGVSEDRAERVKDRVKVVWPLFIPTAISAATTVACIVAANRLEVRKTLAAQSAFALTQQLFDDYREQVLSGKQGASKDQAILDSIAEERVKKNPPPSEEVMVIGDLKVLCYEVYTGRYFACDMETLRRAQNDINAKLLRDDYATLDDLYYMVGLRTTQESGQIGWTSSKQMALQFSSVLTDTGRPCLAFEYNYVKLL